MGVIETAGTSGQSIGGEQQTTDQIPYPSHLGNLRLNNSFLNNRSSRTRFDISMGRFPSEAINSHLQSLFIKRLFCASNPMSIPNFLVLFPPRYRIEEPLRIDSNAFCETKPYLGARYLLAPST
jgi:hypothetical protein